MKISIDKILHFIVCLAIALIVSTVMANIAYIFVPNNPDARAATAYGAALFMALAIGVWKECRDKKQPNNHFCWKDLLADTAGAVVGSCGAFFTYML